MSFIGNVEFKSSDIRRVDVTSSTSATHTLTWTAPNEQSLIVTINGVKQQNNYTVSGTTLTLDTALITTDEMEVIGINDLGTTMTPTQNSITNDMVASNAAIAQSKLATLAIDTAELADDSVTTDKLANSINTEIAANTAKVTNATHTGDVTGATALTIATDAVDIAMLSATGTASASTFLRGDNAWASAGGSNAPYWHVYLSADEAISNAVWSKAQFDTEIYDSASEYDKDTNYRYVFGTAGTYFIYANLQLANDNAVTDRVRGALYKNGSAITGFAYGGGNYQVTSDGILHDKITAWSIFSILTVSASDYIEVFGYTSAYGVADMQIHADSFFGGFKLI